MGGDAIFIKKTSVVIKAEFTDEYQKILWQISLSKDMDVSLQRRLPLELKLSVYEVARKEVVSKQDTYCNHLYVLLKGELEVNIVDVAGSLVKVEDIHVPRAFATPHLFGDKNPLPATFTVSKDSVLSMAIRTFVLRLISFVPGLLHRFLCVTGNCNKCTVACLRILSYRVLHSRLAYYFTKHKTSLNTAMLEYNQAQLAEYLGITYPTLSKEVNKMMREDLISINKKVVALGDMTALKEYIRKGYAESLFATDHHRLPTLITSGLKFALYLPWWVSTYPS